ncbi:hypothetical protein [Streptomyces harbinensis]|uniref:hypothetical protein n=1 Tax=Streptomyces harbinensis TaxID=1176198 RepID=UPI0036B00324
MSTTKEEKQQPVVEQVVEVTPAPSLSAAQEPKPAVPGALPGKPLAVAGVNAAGAVAAGALTVGGPVGLAVAGVTVGAMAAGAVARRAAERRRDRRRFPLSAPQQRGRHAAAGGGVPGQGQRAGTRAAMGSVGAMSRAAVRRPSSPTGASSRRAEDGRGGPAARNGAVGDRLGWLADNNARTRPGGRAGTTSGSGGVSLAKTSPGDRARTRPSTGTGSVANSPGRSGGLGGALRRAAVRARERWQAGAPARAAKAEERKARREARGLDKARRESGLDPATGQSAARVGAGQQSKALRKSALRHAARATGAGLIAGAVGLVSGIWNWKRPGRAPGHARAVWNRLMGRARKVRAARDAAITGEPGAGVPVPAQSVNDPSRPAEKRPAAKPEMWAAALPLLLGAINHREEPDVSDVTETPGSTFSRLSEAADVMLQAAKTFDPEQMVEFQTLIEDLPDAMRTVQETIRVLAELSDEKLPVNRKVVEEIGESYRVMNRVIDALEEVPVVYKRVHAEDIERVDNPRNGVEAERKWNV